mgnify:CR=1 FL=1
MPHRDRGAGRDVHHRLAFAAIMVPAQTLLQRETPHDMIGRVSSTNISVAFCAQILRAGAVGLSAPDHLGVRMVFFFCAGAGGLAMAAGGRAFLHQQR